MITLTDSTYNGFFFKSMENGVGKGVCEKCGYNIDVKSFNELDNLIKHTCKKGDEK